MPHAMPTGGGQSPAGPEGALAVLRPTVLVVDDDADVRVMLARFLCRKYDIIAAADGTEALDVMGRRRLDAVVCDQIMPGLAGIDVLAEAVRLHPHAVRILITAAGDRVLNAEAINDARIHRFLVKPLHLIELESMLTGALREATLAAENERLVAELEEKNSRLAESLDRVREHEEALEKEVTRRTEALARAVTRLEGLAQRDGLTGLYNHRSFQQSLKKEHARAVRHRRCLGLMFVDVDHFKNYNDTFGHPAGDEILRQLATILTGRAPNMPRDAAGRSYEIVARYGGEEFVVLLPETDHTGTLARAERLRQAVEDHAFPGEMAQPGHRLTVSIGVASYPQDAVTAQDLVRFADDALLQAKRNGRNQVCEAPPYAMSAAS